MNAPLQYNRNYYCTVQEMEINMTKDILNNNTMFSKLIFTYL